MTESKFEDQDPKNKRLTKEEILDMVRTAAYDSVVLCPYCEFGNLETDYERCPECNRKNPLQQMGFI